MVSAKAATKAAAIAAPKVPEIAALNAAAKAV